MEHWDIFLDFFVAPQNGGNLFHQNEVDLAGIVYPYIVEEVREIYPQFEFEDSEFDVKYEATKENFYRIVKSFREANKARKEFLQHFPEWSKWRKENISQMKEIAKNIHLDRKNSNISRLVSGSVGIIGGSTVAVSVACPLLIPVTVPLGLVGSAVAGLGGLFLLGTCVTEHLLLNNNMKKANFMLQKETDEFKVMRKWFKHSQDLIVSLETILGLEISLIKWSDFQNIKKNFKNSDISEMQAKARRFVQLIMRNIMHVYPASAAAFLSFGVCLPSIITFFFVMILIHKQNKFIFDCVLMTQRLALGLLSGLDVSVEIGRVIAAVALKGTKCGTEVLTKTAARAVALGVFAGVGIALDVATLVLTSIDVHKGSFSEHGTEIENAAKKFDDEFEFFKEVHEELKDN